MRGTYSWPFENCPEHEPYKQRPFLVKVGALLHAMVWRIFLFQFMAPALPGKHEDQRWGNVVCTSVKPMLGAMSHPQARVTTDFIPTVLPFLIRFSLSPGSFSATMRSPLRSHAQVEGSQGFLPQPEKDIERPSSTRLEARFHYLVAEWPSESHNFSNLSNGNNKENKSMSLTGRFPLWLRW